ncbi:arsenical pump-driving ATPase [Methanofollis tationis]|uniref:TRC40/GET3/ArsA family transport-energizing ATPase n=1 Tax=Methanofollis tationis TaxID=81417 RepID=A0A7K4HNS4_9EURY|nr:arsenical pump-driving ATPase [Methanofollis tationis]NVO66879.1 TRC40/GET3/ArsA family transport-energizing ATPase [Methanofollis tationis]
MIKNLVIPQSGAPRFIFFSGKGGVGKSTMSCATAVWLAKNGYKTLLVTTDPAPNLSDIFGQKIGHRITEIPGVDNLSAIEINPDAASQEYRDRIIAPLEGFLDERNVQGIREQLNSPCIEEVAAFDKFIEFMDKPEYDVVVFDTAPTGHTLRLLELPSGWNSELEKGGATCIGPSASLQTAKTKYEKAIAALQDEAKTSFVFVLKPERLSIFETKRSISELEQLGIKTSFLVINGVLPEEVVTDEFFKKRWNREQEIIEEINHEFLMEKILYPLRNTEVSGILLLDRVGEFLYEGKEEIQEPVIMERAEAAAPAVVHDEREVLALLTPKKGTRYLFFTGKGGVGKSTIAGATSIYLAEKGYRTLILTTDPASHLQVIFGQSLGNEPTKINGVENLYATQIDQKNAWNEYKTRILDAVKDEGQETKKAVEEDLNSPCAQEMAVFEKFMSYFELQGFDIIIFDTAPTGHTLRLLEMPSDWKGFIDLGTLTKKTSDATTDKYAHVIDTMRDREASTFVFVMYPEYTPIIEAWRGVEDLHDQVGIELGMVAINYLLPRNYGNNSYFADRRKQQEKYLHLIREKFPVPLLGVPLFVEELNGVESLKGMRRAIYGEEA